MRIKCPALFCGSHDVTLISGKTKTSLNFNPLHPLTLTSTKAKGKQKFMCNKCGKVFVVKL